ncbi:hypothetical protein BASA81_000863 [Batrachochytrium salamandrivorans]|nr:hypothetical protein BASA81_000863 [Batrachochytrium salamandrivorans]
MGKTKTREGAEAAAAAATDAVVMEEQTRNVDLEFRDWYVNQVTSCFGGEIESLRKQQEEVTAGGVADLNVLISILRTGESTAVFDSLAKSAIVDSFKKQKKSKD